MAVLLKYGTLVLAIALPALASPLLDDRAVCNRNNLVRCFDPTGTASKDIASRAAATAFCSSLLSVPVVTSVITTTTPVSTVTSIVTTTDATEVVTSISTATGIVTETSTTTLTVPAMLAPTPIYVPRKRDSSVCRRGSTGITPPACAGSSAISALSSACGCISVIPSTTYITATAPTSTAVETSIIHETTVTTTETTVSTASTITVTTTTIATASPAPTCSGIIITASNGRRACETGTKLYNNSGDLPEFYPDGGASVEDCLEQCVILGTSCKGVTYNSMASSLQKCQIFYVIDGSYGYPYSYSAVWLD